MAWSALRSCVVYRRADTTTCCYEPRAELDLLDQRAVADFMDEERPDYVFLAAAKVGGIQANDTLRADFLSRTCSSRAT